MTSLTDEVWETFHNYNKLVRRGDAKPLVCPVCEQQYVTTLGKNDTVALRCYRCNTLTSPGLDLYALVRNVVKEHYLWKEKVAKRNWEPPTL